MLASPPVLAQARTQGLLVYAGEVKWRDTALTLARQLQRDFSRREIRLDVVTPEWERRVQTPRELRPKSAPAVLGLVWEQYFQLKLRDALESVLQVQRLRLGHNAQQAATVLEALIRHARGQRRAVRRLLRQVRHDSPELGLPTDVYPPAFVKMFEVGRVRGHPPTLRSDQTLSALKNAAAVYARQQEWKTLWGLRVSSMGWNGQVELSRLVPHRRRSGRSVVIEFERGASMKEMARRLGEKILVH